MFVLLFVLIIALLFFPYIRRAFSRARFWRNFKNECILKRYRTRRLSFFAFYFCNLSDKFDIEVNTGRHLFAIKLWDEAGKNTNVIFAPGGRVYRRQKVADVFGKDGKKSHSVLESKVGVFALAKPRANDKKYACKYLITDGAANIYIYDGKEGTKVRNGGELYGMTLLLRTDILKNISAKDVS